MNKPKLGLDNFILWVVSAIVFYNDKKDNTYSPLIYHLTKVVLLNLVYLNVGDGDPFSHYKTFISNVVDYFKGGAGVEDPFVEGINRWLTLNDQPDFDFNEIEPLIVNADNINLEWPKTVYELRYNPIPLENTNMHGRLLLEACVGVGRMTDDQFIVWWRTWINPLFSDGQIIQAMKSPYSLTTLVETIYKLTPESETRRRSFLWGVLKSEMDKLTKRYF